MRLEIIKRVKKKDWIIPGLFIFVLVGSWYQYTTDNRAFAAAGLTLSIANTSYLNGSQVPTSSWQLSDLDDQAGPSNGNYLFFDFDNIQPGDHGVSQIDVQISDADSWLCLDTDLTQNDDNTLNDPELNSGDSQTPSSNFDGELAQALEFFLWQDDGDAVLEDNEYANGAGIMYQQSFSQLSSAGWLNLADSTGGLLNPSQSALPFNQTYGLAIGWCFGQTNFDPLPQDANTTAIDPLTQTGYTCQGAAVGNASQTDTTQGTLTFAATQASLTPSFTCNQLVD